MSAAGWLGFSTRQLHAGNDATHPHRPRATPIYLTAGFEFEDFDQGHARFAGTDDGFSYTRVGNPTNAALERRIADLESAWGRLWSEPDRRPWRPSCSHS